MRLWWPVPILLAACGSASPLAKDAQAVAPDASVGEPDAPSSITGDAGSLEVATTAAPFLDGGADSGQAIPGPDAPGAAGGSVDARPAGDWNGDGYPPIEPEPAPGPLLRPDWLRAACARRSPAREMAAGEQLRMAVTRRWLVCSDQGLFNRTQAGFEVRPDGRISLLGWSKEGRLEVLHGVDNEGRFYVEGKSQANFESDLGGVMVTFPELSTSPAGIWLNNNGVVTYDYIAVDDVQLGPGIPPASPPPPRNPECQRAPGSAVTPRTVPAMRQSLVRRWVLCSRAGLFGGLAGEAGVEIDAGDNYYSLGRNAQGGLERTSAAGRLTYLGPGDGSTRVQVNFGLTTSLPVITADPAYLIINDFGVREYRYVAVE